MSGCGVFRCGVSDPDGAEISHDRREEEVERVLALSAFVVVEQNSK